MARVYNWQIGREMSYWYPERRPKRQFAAVFDTNKCIACQTCTLACKTTWTSGKGLWRPAALGLRPKYERKGMKDYLSGKFVVASNPKKGGTK